MFCKLADLQCKSAANLLQTKIAIWDVWVKVAQIAILVCSRLALQLCKLSANLSRQVCKCETSLQQVNASLEVTIGRTCSSLPQACIANYSKNGVRTQP
ncbi:hypothetical protein AVEN_49425-1 [Araneus ventricosus]|uniref:Uncharacterized protein n=1 Tax=Araneus ventricosus TaxID=182803 RepID=A0A4Y2CNP3_ARAVE|nr:hypothetical protein AVEN_49425-1 [Araneus ventricosus]